MFKDPTSTRLATLQRYLKQLNKKEELDDDIFDKIWPQCAATANAADDDDNNDELLCGMFDR